MNCKNIIRNIRIYYAVMLSLVLLFAVVAEFNMLPIEGMLINAFSPETQYFVEVGMFFLVGLCILLALKLFDKLWLSGVYEAKDKERASKYVKAYIVRLSLLEIPMLLGAFFYYGLLENWGLYYALAGFVASLFCLPSADVVKEELMDVIHN